MGTLREYAQQSLETPSGISSFRFTLHVSKSKISELNFVKLCGAIVPAPHQICKVTLSRKIALCNTFTAASSSWVPPGTQGDRHWVEVHIGVAWLQLGNARNSPCKHLMLGWSQRSYLLSPALITIMVSYSLPTPPSPSSTCSSCGLCSASAGGVH